MQAAPLRRNGHSTYIGFNGANLRGVQESRV